MVLSSVHPEPMATIIDCALPAESYCQIPAANPTMHYRPSIDQSLLATRSIPITRPRALTTVVVTILDEKFVSTTAHVMKADQSDHGGLLVSGSSVPVSHVLTNVLIGQARANWVCV